MIKKIFSMNCVLDIYKAFGHKEVIKEFSSEKEAEDFIKKVKDKDTETLNELEDDCEIILDDYKCNEVFDYGEWEIDE